MTVEITRSKMVWDHCIQTKTRVVADSSAEAITAMRLIEEYDAAVIAGDEFSEIVERAQRE